MSARNLAVCLLVSVAINFALAGVLLGDHFFGQANALSGAPLRQVLESLPAESRPAVREALREQRFALARALREVRQDRQQVRQLIAAGSSAGDELERALADLRGSTAELQSLMHGALLEGLRAGQAN